jgi:hypothetical protein
MKNQTVQRWVSLGLGLLWMASVGVSSARADGGSQRRPTVRISVYNDAGLKRGTLLRAEEDASGIFRQAGIEMEWNNCGGQEAVAQAGQLSQVGKPCGEAAYPARLVLRISRRPRGLVPEAFGIAYLSQDGQGVYCDVFVAPMEELQMTHSVSLDALLGHVAAHEIAHLLLGANSHSANGLMRAHWNSQSIEELKHGILGFSSPQSSAMVERLDFARDTASDALVTMAGAIPVELSALPAQCPNTH